MTFSRLKTTTKRDNVCYIHVARELFAEHDGLVQHCLDLKVFRFTMEKAKHSVHATLQLNSTQLNFIHLSPQLGTQGFTTKIHEW